MVASVVVAIFISRFIFRAYSNNQLFDSNIINRKHTAVFDNYFFGFIRVCCIAKVFKIYWINLKNGKMANLLFPMQFEEKNHSHLFAVRINTLVLRYAQVSRFYLFNERLITMVRHSWWFGRKRICCSSFNRKWVFSLIFGKWIIDKIIFY